MAKFSARVLGDVQELEPANRVVTMGTFDGVHLGHQHLIQRTIQRAKKLGMRSLAVTFEPPPVSVLRPDAFLGRVAPPEDKLRALAGSGVDEVLVVPFTLETARLSPEAFLEPLIGAGMRELWVGEDFALGRSRAGTPQRLAEIGEERGFQVEAIQKVVFDGEPVSSSRIRQAVQIGNVAEARRLLGRPYRTRGVVIHGAHLGRTIGFPTANVEPPADLVPLADGIYVALATLPDNAGPRPAMTYVGTRPTVNSGPRLVETHLLDFDGDLYGQTIEVDVLERLRADQAFGSLEELVQQLHRDERATRAFLAEDRAKTSDPTD